MKLVCLANQCYQFQHKLYRGELMIFNKTSLESIIESDNS